MSQRNTKLIFHVYFNNQFVAVIECKNYLDSCYYSRACHDFLLFQKFGYSLQNFIFSIEDSIKNDSRLFMDIIHENICHEIFYIVDGKRSSTKPIYNLQYMKKINDKKLKIFFEKIYALVNLSFAMS